MNSSIIEGIFSIKGLIIGIIALTLMVLSKGYKGAIILKKGALILL